MSRNATDASTPTERLPQEEPPTEEYVLAETLVSADALDEARSRNVEAVA